MSKPGKKVKLKVRVDKKRREKPLEERVIKDSEFIENFDEKVEHYVDDYVEKIDKTKRLTLISGVAFFMLLIVSFYAYNFKLKVVNLAESNIGEASVGAKLNTIKNDIGNIVDEYQEAKENLSVEIKQKQTNNQEVLPEIPDNIVSENKNNSIEKNSIKILKEKLLEGNNQE